MKHRTGFYTGIGASFFAVIFFLASCANIMPVPGGSEAVNDSCFASETEFRSYISSLTPGMPETVVLKGLCRKKEDIAQIDRRDIRITLLGGDNIDFPHNGHLIEQLYGYRLHYKNIKRKHGFSSPIRIQTKETGYSYTVTVIFHDGRLFTQPAVSGGPVRNTSSGTLFDFLTPGAIVNHTID